MYDKPRIASVTIQFVCVVDGVHSETCRMTFQMIDSWYLRDFRTCCPICSQCAVNSWSKRWQLPITNSSHSAVSAQYRRIRHDTIINKRT